jgi:hypothetical protein
MKVENLTNSNGNKVKNQFIITEEGRGALGNFTTRETFQSYDTVICIRTAWPDKTEVELDADKWAYSKTTSRARAAFLGETTKETERKIKSGEYKLANLNP